MLQVHNLGICDYREMLATQRHLFSEMVEAKKKGIRDFDEHIFLLEHNPVLTLGKHGHRDNLIVSAEMLATRGIELVEIERGGDITYHGPGQLVVYPLLDLERHHLGVKKYVDLLEESVIRTIGEYGFKAGRVEGASGVWLGIGTPQERKICALGVKCSRYITMHGLALNVNTDLDGFRLINPCGFTDKGVTSMARELSRPLDMAEVKDKFLTTFTSLLNS